MPNSTKKINPWIKAGTIIGVLTGLLVLVTAAGLMPAMSDDLVAEEVERQEQGTCRPPA